VQEKGEKEMVFYCNFALLRVHHMKEN